MVKSSPNHLSYWEGGVINSTCKLRKAYMMVKEAENFEFVMWQCHFSLLTVDNEDSAHYQSFMFNNFGEAVVKVIFLDGCSVGLEEIHQDFMSWYSSLFDKVSQQPVASQRMEVELALGRLLRRIWKELPKIYPRYTTGNWIDGIACFDGEGRLFNMRYDANGHVNDLTLFHHLIEEITLLISPTHINDLVNSWNPSVARDGPYYEKICSQKIGEFLLHLNYFLDRQLNLFYPYRPLVWKGDERTHFLEMVYDIIWKEQKVVNEKFLKHFEVCFELSWVWWKLVPIGGTYHKLLEFGQLETPPRPIIRRRVDSIPFFRNSRHHHNTYSPIAKRVVDIEEEMNGLFNICFNVFYAVEIFVNDKILSAAYWDIAERFHELLSSIGCIPLTW